LSRKLQDIHIQQQAQAHAYAHYMYNAQYGHFPGNPYDGFTPSYRPANVPYGYPLPIPTYPSGPAIPTCPAKDQDIGAGVRSVLLEEFRSNSKANKKYELRVRSYEYQRQTNTY
jgi:mRNA-binding protein PUF3